MSAVSAKNCPENVKNPTVLDVLSLEDHLFGYKLGIDDELEGTNIEGYTDFINKAFYVPLKTYNALVRGYNNNRERFTTTHEAGHIILHRHYFETQTFIAARVVSGSIETYKNPEWQANAAAGSLLMPLTTFYPEYKRLKATGYFSQVQTLASKFQVSTDAVSVRIQTLANKGVKNLILRLGL